MKASPQDRVAAPDDAFGFGRNWQEYLAEHLDPERERIAAESLSALVERDLDGKTFLDVGCGSGLFSLCAHRAGAAVTSMDVDPDSVAATASLRQSVGAPDSWRVIHGSILDAAVVEELPVADVVYSWGVLHHTGDMQTAIRNAASRVAPGGLFAIAIYNRANRRILHSARWARIKRRYNHSPRPVQRLMELLYAAYWTATRLYHGQNPLKEAREYKRLRGMALRTDLVDWLGGWPYEYATAEEIVRFCERECGLRTVKVIPEDPKGLGNHELVFERPPA